MPDAPSFWTGALLMMLMSFAGFSCDHPTGPTGGLPEPRTNAAEPTDAGPREAVFAGGCFWCVEAVFQQLAGVSEVTSGYAGGDADSANYEQVASGMTDHAEVVRVVYDPNVISYAALLRVFFATHDPTQLNRQGPDHGRQYRSAIFYKDEHQQRAAADYIAQLTEANAYDRPIVTTLEPLDAFYEAEQYHQDFADRNPMHPYIRQWALPKVDKVQTKFPEKLRDPTD
ncbi:peptide-methionine (S)-S-oxide reductase MsrA [Phycisphaerales bacterium AB-hyl4]|uniref:Peptide methionine sulfoxide reductase MsrA n=1 Tax=Natronomicrosphaera hydrolytica TaxID=3242702 RepID=A0ABV4U0L9_9BACT